MHLCVEQCIVMIRYPGLRKFSFVDSTDIKFKN